MPKRNPRNGTAAKRSGGWNGERAPGDESLVLTPAQVSRYLCLTERSVYAMLVNGEFEAEKVGRLWLIPKKKFFDRFGWPQDLRRPSLPPEDPSVSHKP